MKTRRKGTHLRTKCRQELENLGYRVDVVEKTGKFVKVKDMFSLFDLVAIKKEGPVMFVQVTCRHPHSHKPYDEFAAMYPQIAVEQWVWVDRKGFKKYIY